MLELWVLLTVAREVAVHDEARAQALLQVRQGLMVRALPMESPHRAGPSKPMIGDELGWLG